MNILDLDEAQGLTPEMVREYCRRHKIGLLIDQDGIEEAIDKLALIAGVSIQALLREINPRMRPGVPGDAARDAHPRLWLGHMGGRYPVAQIGYFATLGGLARSSGGFAWDLTGPISTEYPPAFWPCDGSGNKLRWHERDGVML